MYDEMYTDTVIEHFMCPRNVGSMNDADGEGTIGDPGCGDSMTIYIKVRNEIIEDISFLVFGCAAAIATSSMTTELAKGKTIEEAMKITEDDIVEALGGLPENKKHCSNLGVKALRSAIENYYSRKVLNK
ncbi:MAG: nitrogen fixation protein NifU [Clostridiales bacterium]|jgi:nitrogen fixation NifU-like protein|nr:nitrogen fixation protein NifU [Clostridiales bacterium]MDK2932955.1 nitrogen fixation protein NifU [Clostridiales bacterium]